MIDRRGVRGLRTAYAHNGTRVHFAHGYPDQMYGLSLCGRAVYVSDAPALAGEERCKLCLNIARISYNHDAARPADANR